jgi:hypothetical protein
LHNKSIPLIYNAVENILIATVSVKDLVSAKENDWSGIIVVRQER